MKIDKKNKFRVTFYGGTESVTGANFLIEDGDSGIKILVDCGFFQGSKIGDDENRKSFPYNPSEIDFLFITHAHIDHIGRIPKLVRDGFKGKIYSTTPTKQISEIMLSDSLGILTKEAKHDHKPVIYDEKNVVDSMKLWEEAPYYKPIELGDGISAVLKDAGHILGSAMISFERDGRKILFTGDLGNSPAPLLRDTDVIDDANYIVMESVYGDRNHEDITERKQIFEDVIEDTIKKGGALMIPAFSLERTQDILFEMNDLVENGRIPSVPVFLDSPLAIKVTNIYKKNEEYFNTDASSVIKSGDDIFKFPNLKFTLKTEESKEIKNVQNPKIIIAGSGMSNGGRIVHHEKQYLPDPKSTLLIVGYQAPGTLGRIIEDGVKTVKILGDMIPVRASIRKISGYSAHKDSDSLLDFVQKDSSIVEKVFVVMGELKSSTFLVQKIRDYLGVDAVSPRKGEVAVLDF
jgi:metallo-beta-lactamase family protein